MFSKTKAKSFALGLALVLALTAAPQALAGPSLGGDLGSAVYGFIAQIWQSLSSVVGPQEEADFGPLVGPNGLSRAETSGPMVIPNGVSSEADEKSGPGQIPNGLTVEESENEIGAGLIPNG